MSSGCGIFCPATLCPLPLVTRRQMPANGPACAGQDKHRRLTRRPNPTPGWVIDTVHLSLCVRGPSTVSTTPQLFCRAGLLRHPRRAVSRHRTNLCAVTLFPTSVWSRPGDAPTRVRSDPEDRTDDDVVIELGDRTPGARSSSEPLAPPGRPAPGSRPHETAPALGNPNSMHQDPVPVKCPLVSPHERTAHRRAGPPHGRHTHLRTVAAPAQRHRRAVVFSAGMVARVPYIAPSCRWCANSSRVGAGHVPRSGSECTTTSAPTTRSQRAISPRRPWACSWRRRRRPSCAGSPRA